MAEQQDNAAALRAALAQPTTSTQLPKVGKTRQFGLAFAGALDPRFQESTAGPILEAERNRTQLQGQLDEKARLQNINQLAAINELDRQGIADERAAAQEGREVSRFGDEQAADQLNTDIFQATLSTLPSTLEGIEIIAAEAEEKLGPEAAAYLRGLAARLQEATNSMIGDDASSVEDPDGTLEEKFGAFLETIDDGIRDTVTRIEGSEQSDEDIEARIAVAKINRQPKERGPEQIALDEARAAKLGVETALLQQGLEAGPEEDEPKPISDAITVKIGLRNASIRALNTAQGAAEGIRDDLGKLGVALNKPLPEWAKDPALKSASAKILLIMGKLRNKLLGGALSPQEIIIANEFIDSAITLDIDGMILRIESLREREIFDQQGVFNSFEGAGRPLGAFADFERLKFRIPEGVPDRSILDRRGKDDKGSYTIWKTPEGVEWTVRN